MMIKPPLPFSDDWINTVVSEGTLKSEDLVMRFTDIIKRSCIQNAAWVEETLIPSWQDVYDSITTKKFDDDFSSSEAIEFSMDLAELTTHLFDILNTLAPDGCTFGSTEGDAACFGFFTVDEHV